VDEDVRHACYAKHEYITALVIHYTPDCEQSHLHRQY
jgi:hypothetical protein